MTNIEALALLGTAVGGTIVFKPKENIDQSGMLIHSLSESFNQSSIGNTIVLTID